MVTGGARVICIPDGFLLPQSKQPPKYTNLLISISDLPELYILTNSGVKVGHKQPKKKKKKTLETGTVQY